MNKVDGLILLLGQAGVGKSTFINRAAGKEVAEVGHVYDSSTSEVSGFVVQSTSSPHRITLVDTPGFNDTWLKDVDILSQIIVWLKGLNDPVNVYGIIYLHDIVRHSPTYGAGLLTPIDFSQPYLVKNVCLVTVGWTDKGMPTNLQPREHNLKAKSWRLMTKAGSQVNRFEHTHESAWNIIEGMKNTTAIPLEIFIGQLEAVRNHLAQHTPMHHGHGSVAGFFSVLFGRKKKSEDREQ